MLDGYFKENYPEILETRDSNWLRYIPKCERKAFSHIGFVASGYGRKGGRARAQTAKRDWKGRFMSNGN